MDAQLLQNHWIVSSGERHGGARISGVSRAPQHETGRGEIAARNQIIRSLERRGDFIGIEAVDRISRDRGLRDRCRRQSGNWRRGRRRCGQRCGGADLWYRTLVGRRDFLSRRCDRDRCDGSNVRGLVCRRR